ncbi:MAG: hypothetical protein CME64_08300 [Halobacteriovoraceae bacterium]|nr:hypothetical protein [Halobacteriovoraceae bacterium]
MNDNVSVFSYKDYVTFLDDLLSSKRKSDLTYSQITFANELGISPPRLSQILKGKEGISVKRAKEITPSLDLSEKESEYFYHLVTSRTSRSPKQREESLRYIEENQRQYVPASLPMSKIGLIDLEGWDVIWNLFEINADFSDLKKISFITKLSVSEIEAVLTKMEEIGLIEINDGTVKRLSTRIKFGNSLPSESIRNYHQRKLQDAIKALDTQDKSTRKNETLTFTMKKSDFEKLSLKIENFIDNFLNDTEETDHDEISTITIAMHSRLEEAKKLH